MDLWELVAESQVLEQFTPVMMNTLYKEQVSGYVVKMDSGLAKNPDVSIQTANYSNKYV